MTYTNPAANEGRPDLRADVRAIGTAASRTVVGAAELHRLSVGGDGRLFWDDKPVLVRRRLVLTFWQKLGAIVIGLAALAIATSILVRTGIVAHDWMCTAKWVSGSCPGALPPPPPPAPPLPELPT